jgi:hypothetical protein
MNAYTETTEDITVTVRPVYVDGQSDVITKKFVFAYFVRIENHGEAPVRLLRRHWFIHDSTGGVKEVEGEGVVACSLKFGNQILEMVEFALFGFENGFGSCLRLLREENLFDELVVFAES